MGDSLNKRENWNGLIGFILAGAGSAVGLGNVWKFPYITGMNGGVCNDLSVLHSAHRSAFNALRDSDRA